MEFEWNSDKGTLNLEKHCVSFEEAATDSDFLFYRINDQDTFEIISV